MKEGKICVPDTVYVWNVTIYYDDSVLNNKNLSGFKSVPFTCGSNHVYGNWNNPCRSQEVVIGIFTGFSMFFSIDQYDRRMSPASPQRGNI